MRETSFGDKKYNNNSSNSSKIQKKPVNKPLFSKGLLVFLRTFLSFSAILSFFVFYYPKEVYAGFCVWGLGWCDDSRMSLSFVGETGANSISSLSSDSAISSFLRTPPSDKSNFDVPLIIVEGSALLVQTNPLGFMADGVGGAGDTIFVYEVQPGDKISDIASSFGVSVNTILWANDISNPGKIRAGDKLLILPISGVRHEVRKNDSIAGIAKKYGASVADILSFNGILSDEDLVLGETIIVPDGEEVGVPTVAVPKSSSSSLSKLPEFQGFFMKPIHNARRSRGLHGKNGVDLINSDASGPSCGKPVFASAEGTVLIAKDSGFNGGYGKYIVISHRNGTQTLYAHLKQILVKVGQSVVQGLTIGQVGSTGNSTGCHVHFEVRGAKNPF